MATEVSAIDWMSRIVKWAERLYASTPERAFAASCGGAMRATVGRAPFRGVFVQGGKRACVYDADDRMIVAVDVGSYKRMVLGG